MKRSAEFGEPKHIWKSKWVEVETESARKELIEEMSDFEKKALQRKTGEYIC